MNGIKIINELLSGIKKRFIKENIYSYFLVNAQCYNQFSYLNYPPNTYFFPHILAPKRGTLYTPDEKSCNLLAAVLLK